jgi:pSer/pThr/pTyr-binding forkhead associated (FHA) protein
MTEGPLAGKEFLIFRDTMNIGSSPRSEIYLFNDSGVAPTHAQLRVIGDETEITARDRVHPLMVNQSVVKNARLRHGDRITIGSTSFVFEQRQR